MTNLRPILHLDHHPNLSSSGGLLFDERNWTTFQRALTLDGLIGWGALRATRQVPPKAQAWFNWGTLMIFVNS
jgi:hypothetical protein